MNVRELSRFQLNALKESYICETVDSPSWEDLANAENIPDSVIFDYYSGIHFVDDDFFCTVRA